MTAQPRKQRDRKHAPRRTPGPPPPEDDITADTASRAGQDSHGGWLACSAHEAAWLTGRSRDLLYDQVRFSNLACVKVGMWRPITRPHLQQVLGITS